MSLFWYNRRKETLVFINLLQWESFPFLISHHVFQLLCIFIGFLSSLFLSICSENISGFIESRLTVDFTPTRLQDAGSGSSLAHREKVNPAVCAVKPCRGVQSDSGGEDVVTEQTAASFQRWEKTTSSFTTTSLEAPVRLLLCASQHEQWWKPVFSRSTEAVNTCLHRKLTSSSCSQVHRAKLWLQAATKSPQYELNLREQSFYLKWAQAGKFAKWSDIIIWHRLIWELSQ